MLKFASDADVHGAVVRALIRAEYLAMAEGAVDDVSVGVAVHALNRGNFDFDVLVSVQRALPEGTPDPDVLEWAAGEGRVLLTNDRSTMIGYARERVRTSRPMPGLIVLPPHRWIGKAIEDVQVIAGVCTAEELRDRIVFLPLKPGDLPGSATTS